MKKNYLVFGVFVSILFGHSPATQAQGPSSKGPRILQMSGAVQMQTARDKDFEKANPKRSLAERARFRTGSDAQVRIQVSPHLILELLPDSEIHLPGISWDSGSVPVIELLQGQLLWEQTSSESSELKSALYDLFPPSGIFVFEMNAKTAEAGVRVYRGELSFKAMNGEDAVSVNEGHRAKFQGVIEEGEVAYDILLQGRKVPRGVLGKAEVMTGTDLDFFKIRDQELKKKALAQAAKAKKIKPKKTGTICGKPSGRFNECAWICENNPRASKKCRTDIKNVRCYRVRCNANGQWADRMDLSAEEAALRCEPTEKVSACDY